MVPGIAIVAALAAWSSTRAESDLKVMETRPADHAVLDKPSEGFFVRFDRPVDHIHSLLEIRRGGKVVESLQPRFKTAPEVLFARVPELPAGDYTFHWSVRTLQGGDVVEGEVPFSVAKH
jgi:methionine-rich copper-binding protein CopC